MKTRIEKNKKIQKKITREEYEKKFKFIFKLVSIIFIVCFIIITYGVFIGAKYTIINEYKITDNLVPNSFHGIKIVHISDILYNSLNKDDLRRIKNKINSLDADILIFTGDIKKKEYELTKEDINLLENFFKNLNSNITKYAVIGDNDDNSFYTIMENSNFKILSNQENILYYKENTPIRVIGVDLDNIKLDIKEGNYYTICIMHNPDKIDEVLNLTNCNLGLAGDNLGGEIKLPYGNGLLDNHKYNKKYYRINETEFYISNGLGNNHKIRLFNQPSVNLYRLTSY